jgi:uncharacterized protein (TIGR00725 family)
MKTPGDHPIIAVFGSSQTAPGDPAYAEAATCGRLLAESGYTVATGGYGGTMEAVSRGAAEAGGHVIGITTPTMFPRRSGPNAWVAQEQPAASLTERVHKLIGGSDAAIALPGSLGTLAELTVSWHIAETAHQQDVPAPPIIAVGQQWATRLREIAQLLGITTENIVFAPSAAAAVTEVQRRVPTTRRPQTGS